ncbi:MAG TPA: acyltransferase [Solirubrobacteraceae bacterium]|nr:acyltransferase [Solirubrobacteraceae bacterium]
MGVAASHRGHDASALAQRRTSAPAIAVNRDRVAYLDNLKVLLVAVIIAGHSILGYQIRLGSWPHQTVREVSLGRVSQAILAIPLVPAGLFAMGLFFLISGLVTPSSVARKGPGRFARDRTVRLGVPLAVWTLGVWPALLFARDRVGGTPVTFWSEVVHRHPFLEPGPMWFVEVLLIYSLGYAAWRHWRTHHASRFATRSRHGADGSRRLQGRTLVVLAVGISLATLLVRPVFPLDSRQAGDGPALAVAAVPRDVRLWHRRCSARLA